MLNRECMNGIAASTDVMHCGDALFIEKPVGRTLIRSFGGIKFRMRDFVHTCAELS